MFNRFEPRALRSMPPDRQIPMAAFDRPRTVDTVGTISLGCKSNALIVYDLDRRTCQ